MVTKRQIRKVSTETIGIALMMWAVLTGCGQRLDNQPLVWKTIHEAAARGDLADVKRHLARGASVNEWANVADLEGLPDIPCLYHFDRVTPLHMAAITGHKDVVKYLIAKGADVNAIVDGSCGEAPALPYAAYYGLTEMVELLVASGADVNTKDGAGNTPLNWVIGSSDGVTGAAREDMIKLLIGKGADVNIRDNGGETPLHEAAILGDWETAGLLIAKGANVNAKDKEGRTPLGEATGQGRKDVADLLRSHGATE